MTNKYESTINVLCDHVMNFKFLIMLWRSSAAATNKQKKQKFSSVWLVFFCVCADDCNADVADSHVGWQATPPGGVSTLSAWKLGWGV